MEGKRKQALESLVFAIPTTDLVGAGEKVAKFFGKDGKKLTTIAKTIKISGTAAAVYIAADRTGQGIASLIDDYAVAGRKVDLQFWLRALGTGVGAVQTTAYGRTLGKDFLQYTNAEEKLQEVWAFAKAKIKALHKNNKGSVRIDVLIGRGGRNAPNPYGKKGGPAHQQVIEKIKQDAKVRELSYETEFRFDTSGGFKNCRYADLVVFDSQGRVMEIHQVGRTTKKYGAPVARERKAIRDIRSSTDYNGAKIIYHPYDK